MCAVFTPKKLEKEIAGEREKPGTGSVASLSPAVSAGAILSRTLSASMHIAMNSDLFQMP